MHVLTRRMGLLLAAAVMAFAIFTPLGCSLIGIRTTEMAGYEVLRKDGSVELRQYDELVVAETEVSADYGKAGNKAFRRLFDYISGKNAGRTKIAMTAPVLTDEADDAGEKIAMTAPVLAEQREGSWRVAFVLPSSFTMENAPAPSRPDVRLSAIPSKKVAALRYSGSWSEEKMRRKADELATWISENGLQAISGLRSARYDPPWTLWFLRRNEVLVDVE